MPAIFQKDKVAAIAKDWDSGNYTRNELSAKHNMCVDNIDRYLLAALKASTQPAIAYKEKKLERDKQPQLFNPPVMKSVAVKKFVRPEAVYSNQVPTYGRRDFKSLLEQAKM